MSLITNEGGIFIGNITDTIVQNHDGNPSGVYLLGDVVGNVYTNFVFDQTNGQGVSIEGVLFKSGNIIGNTTGNLIGPILCATKHVETDLILEKTLDNGIEIDGITVKDGNITGNLTFDTLFSSGSKGDLLVHNGSNWIQLGVGSNDTALVADSGQSSGVVWKTAPGGNKYLEGFFEEKSTSSSSYTVLARFIFPGTTNLGTINNIKIISRRNSDASSYSARVWNFSNATQICEATGLTNTTRAIVNLGTLSNLPSSQSIFEVQLRRVGGDGRAYLHAVQVEYKI